MSPPIRPLPPIRLEREIGEGAVVVFDVVELAERILAWLSREVLLGRSPFRRPLDLGPDVPRADRAEDLRRIGDRLSTHRDRERRGGRVAPRRDGPVDEGAHCGRQQGLLRGQRAVPLHRQIPASERRTPHEIPYDVGVEAPGSQQRSLYGDGSKLVTCARVHVGKDGYAVGPRRLARRGRCHLERSTRDGRCDHRRLANPDRIEARRRRRPKSSIPQIATLDTQLRSRRSAGSEWSAERPCCRPPGGHAAANRDSSG